MQGYKIWDKEFEGALRKITMLGYGLCIICHNKIKNVAGPNGTTIEMATPSIPDRAVEIINRMVDIIAYIDLSYDEEGNAIRRFITRGTPTIKAGNRLPYLDPIIPFSYEGLVDAIGRAIDEQEKRDGAIVVDHHIDDTTEVLNYKELRDEAAQLWEKLVTADENNAVIILKKAEILFGRSIRLSEITEDQVSILQLLVIEMREMAASL